MITVATVPSPQDPVLQIRYPITRVAEREYILRELLTRGFGLSLQLCAENRRDTLITLGDGRSLLISDGFLAMNEELWLTAASMPGPPELIDWPAQLDPTSRVEPKLPVLPRSTPDETATERGQVVSTSSDGNTVHIDLDLFGSAFFLMSRYEEVAAPVADQFDRYPATAAYASRHGFLDRPVVDEYRAILQACMRRLWSELPLRTPQFRMEVSHDVDLPLRHAWASLPRMLGAGARDLVRTGSLSQWRERASSWYAVRHRREYERDPYNTFGALMAHSESRGLRSAFYFITERPAGNIDALYEIDDPFIETLIGRIHQAGHEIGLHPSFGSFLDESRTRREFERLRRVCERQRVRQTRWGGRQHFLRWRAPDTYRNWEAAGLDYDSTLGFAQQCGFRCSTSHEFQAFDLLWRRPLRLTERPLVVMDSTLADYMKLGFGEAPRKLCAQLKSRCRRHGGVFSLLWHNSNLTKPEQWRLYLDILDC